MNTLPETILADIISYVRHTDLRSVRLVSRKFYRVSLSASIVSREKFVYQSRICADTYDNIKELPPQLDRKFHHFIFDSADLTMEYFERLVQDQGRFIHSLECWDCIIDDQPRFWRLLARCKNLKTLILWYCKAPNLLTDLNYNATAISLASLEYFDMEPVRVNRPSSDDKFVKIAPNARNFSIDDSSSGFDRALFHITAKLDRIQIIALSGDICSNENLTKIADLNFTDLREIHMKYSHHSYADGLKYFVKKQRGLQVLRIKYCEVLNNELLLTIGDCLKNLTTLHGGICLEQHESVFEGLISVMSRTSVRQLRLWSTRLVEPVDLITAIDEMNADAGLTNYKYNELNLKNAITLSYEQLEYIARNFPALTNLHLTYANVTNDGLRIICKYLINLKILNLTGCNEISDDGFDTQPSFGERLGNLEELYLKDCPLISDTTIQNYLKLPYLRLLNLANCTGLTANGFVALSDNCICLETLNMCTIEVDVERLLTTVCSLERLRVLNIQVCGGFTEDLLQSLYNCSNSLMEIPVNNVFGYVRSWDRKKFVWCF